MDRLKRRLGYLSILRVSLFIITLGLPLCLLYGQILRPALAFASALPFLIAFVFALVIYGRLQRKLRLARGQWTNYDEDRVRLEPEWWQKLSSHAEPAQLSRDHAYADDLGLFGRFSLFQYLDRTVTPVGRARLVDLFANQPDAVALNPAAHRERTRAIRELAGRPVFRQRFRREGRPLADSYRELFAPDWIEGIRRLPDASIPRVLVWIAWILPAITLASYIGFEMQWTRAYFLLSLPVQILLFFWMHYRHRHIAPPHARIVDQLSGFDGLFRVASGYRGGQAEHLLRLAVLAPEPAIEIRRLSSLAGYFNFRRNPLLHGLAGIFLLYEAHLIFALGKWQTRCRDRFADWFRELAELDALLALAAAVDTDLDYCFAENLNDLPGPAEGLYMEARELAHPLIRATDRVPNDVRIQKERKLWLITGSNMSGKSTFLRTVGTSLVLAMIGAPVIARSFRFRPLRLFTSMNQRDDLSRSLSLFYAEVKRIKLLQEAARQVNPSTLCLVDEMLRGTNARERLIASKGILERLRESPAFALVATHDMDLIELASTHSDVICYHFQEIIDENPPPDHPAMSFDYRLKEGPVRSSNALKILEMEGVRL